MSHPITAEALWALGAIESLVTDEDTAVLFVSWNALDANLRALKDAWAHPKATHAVAIKTQPHPSVLEHMVAKGFGLEAASWEEVELALAAGCPPERLVFDSPVKTRREIELCARTGPGMLVNANSLLELPRLAPYADRIRIGLRLNPMVATDSPDLFDVSRDDSKFGEPISRRGEILSAVLEYPITALHVHPGSSMTSIDAAVESVQRVVDLAEQSNRQLQASGLERRIRTIDIGGGLAPDNPSGAGESLMTAYVQGLRERAPQLWTDFDVVTEFGQWVHHHTGYAISDIEYVLNRTDRQIAFVHLGADFLLRDAYVQPRGINWIPTRNGRIIDGETLPTGIAGPLCFAGDYLEREIDMPRLHEGDRLVMLGTGSNALGLWSRHTSRAVPPVVGVDYAEQRVEVLTPRFKPFA
jgi:diaminopimelate decarboxylase